MKHNYLLLFLLSLISFSSFSQISEKKSNGIFYKISIATALFTSLDYIDDTEDDGKYNRFTGFFLNNTLGYQFDERSCMGLNLEYNLYTRQKLNVLPAYLSFQYIVKDNLFFRAGYGGLIGLSESFEKGEFIKFGLGVRGEFGRKNTGMIGIDFSTRHVTNNTKYNSITSASIFFEYIFF